MSRKLPNGDYLVPQLLDKVVREYTPDGKIAWEAKTPEMPAEAWPFTAIRLANGNTLTTCTHAKMVVQFDKDGKVVWQLSNDDLPKPLLVDPCGAQRLPNGNTVITSYGQNKPGEVKLLEVTPEKKVVWTYRDNKPHGIHEFQILDTNVGGSSGKIALVIAGVVPFAAMGMVLALLVPFSSAPGIANMIYLPMSFCGGLWIPIMFLPHILQRFALLLPTYHVAQLMLGAFGYASAGSTLSHWFGLFGFTLLMLGIAWIAFRRLEQNS